MFVSEDMADSIIRKTRMVGGNGGDGGREHSDDHGVRDSDSGGFSS